MIPFSLTPFALRKPLTVAKVYTFLEAWQGLLESLTSEHVVAYYRPQTTYNDDCLYYQLTNRDDLRGLQTMQFRELTLETVYCSKSSMMATQKDLDIQAAVDRWSGMYRGHRFQVIHRDVSKTTHRNGNDWVWLARSTWTVYLW